MAHSLGGLSPSLTRRHDWTVQCLSQQVRKPRARWDVSKSCTPKDHPPSSDPTSPSQDRTPKVFSLPKHYWQQQGITCLQCEPVRDTPDSNHGVLSGVPKGLQLQKVHSVHLQPQPQHHSKVLSPEIQGHLSFEALKNKR